MVFLKINKILKCLDRREEISVKIKGIQRQIKESTKRFCLFNFSSKIFNMVLYCLLRSTPKKVPFPVRLCLKPRTVKNLMVVPFLILLKLKFTIFWSNSVLFLSFPCKLLFLRIMSTLGFRHLVEFSQFHGRQERGKECRVVTMEIVWTK